MACPRVFISSTCYDLADVRDNLIEFVKSFGFDTILSEKGDVFFHPDLHTHDACIKEIQNCQLFILIIGGRFGGNYIADTNKSIVNAEYNAAKELNIPVFTFVKNEVNEDHRVYIRNKENANSIFFPSIEKQEYSIKIFNFLDNVRTSKVNNGYSSFKYTNEIKSYLRKQWAGMFYDFLVQRSQYQVYEKTQSALLSISSINEKIEDLSKSILRSVNKVDAEKVILNLEKENDAKQLLLSVKKDLGIDYYSVSIEDFKAGISDNKLWYNFFTIFSGIKLDENITLNYEEGKKRECSFLSYRNTNTIVVDGEMAKLEKRESDERAKLFNSLKNLNASTIMKIYNEVILVPF